MGEYHIFLFDTAFGRAGLARGPRGLRAIAFPGLESDVTIAANLRGRAPAAETVNAPPPEIARTAESIVAFLGGESADFSDVVLDEEGAPEFDRAVWALAREIPRGEVKTYGDLARALGDISLSRRVGQALGRNPFPIIVPCHRIVGADGAMTGFSAPGGAEAKRRLLQLEGAIEPDLFD